MDVYGKSKKRARDISKIWQKKIREGALSIFYQIQLMPHKLFRSSPLTKSLEQAYNRLPSASN